MSEFTGIINPVSALRLYFIDMGCEVHEESFNLAEKIVGDAPPELFANGFVVDSDSIDRLCMIAGVQTVFAPDGRVLCKPLTKNQRVVGGAVLTSHLSLYKCSYESLAGGVIVAIVAHCSERDAIEMLGWEGHLCVTSKLIAPTSVYLEPEIVSQEEA